MSELVLINSPMQVYSADHKPEYFTTAPIGLGYLATISNQEGHEATIIDAEAERLSPQETVERVQAYLPRVVGINVFSTNHQIATAILNRIEAPVKYVGGPHATLDPTGLRGDYTIVTGEAESVFPSLLKQDPGGIVNAQNVENLDSLPFVDRSLFIGDPYDTPKGLEASISTSRGCKHKCAYCSVPTINGRVMRARSVDNVLDEIEELQETGVKRIHFIDDLFNYTPQRVEEFCDRIEERELDFEWRALFRTDKVNDALLEKVAVSGCYKLAFGVESATPRILKYIGKSQDTDNVKRVFEKCNELGIETKGFFTVGYPTETEEDIQRTIDFALELQPNDARFMVVRAFPGTRLHADMIKKGMKPEQLDEYYQFATGGEHVKYHVMNIHALNGMDPEQLDGYIKDAYIRFNKGKIAS